MRITPGVLQGAMASGWRRCVWRIACVMAIGAILAGCDRCGDWVSPMPGSCRQDAPKIQ